MMNNNINQNKELERLTHENAALEAQVRILKEIIHELTSAKAGHPAIGATDDESVIGFRKLTTKQHAALQMIIRGASNKEIADRFGISENTAKVHVRGIMRKLGATNRAQAVYRAKPAFDDMPDEEYERLVGIPKTWDANHEGVHTDEPLLRARRNK